jgi:heterodisulfide reductase subunit B
MKFSYYPGCTLKTRAQALDEAGRRAAAALGVELIELEAWQCCGAVYPQASDEIATRLSAIRALAAAKAEGRDLVTLCSACHHVLKRTNHDVRQDADMRLRANNYLKLETPYLGETRVVHYLEMLRDHVGWDAIRRAAVNPLKGRKIAAYYGCLLLRPSAVMAFDDPENPSIMEDFIRAVGADAVVFPMRNECCGGYVTLEDRAQAQRQAARVIESAAEKGAEAIITACPLCLYNLRESAGEKLPVVYFTEILAEALGVGGMA